MPDRISRRTALAGISAVAVASAQAPPPQSVHPEDKLQKANADVKDSSAKLAQISISIDLEPATTFHV